MAERIVQQPGSTSRNTHYDQLPAAEVERSTFDRSRKWISTLPEAGRLYPMFVEEYLPGDTFSVNTTAFVRLATPLKPIMDLLHVDMHFFAVDNRLVYQDWYNLMGERKSLEDSPDDYSVPQMTADLATAYNTIIDYMGLPVGRPVTLSFNAMPILGYYLIWNEWFRDQSLIEPYDLEAGSVLAVQPPLSRAKHRDYFSSALPWPQKGDPVLIPLGELAPVQGIGIPTTEDGQDTSLINVKDTAKGTTNYPFGFVIDDTPVPWYAEADQAGAAAQPQIFADLSAATAVSINDLRTAFQIQKLLERDARSGSRYVEMTMAHFGVQTADRRAFRPEYLGGGTSIMNVSPVAATVPTEEAPQGELAAVGTGLTKGGFTHSFVEHGFVIGLISVRSELTYQQGVERMWTRETRYDYYFPVFAHLGEQAVKNKEIFLQGTEEDEGTFGYQERWSEYRTALGKVCGQFRSDHPESLDVWHLAQDFATLPTLGPVFIRDNPPVGRVIAVPSEPHFLADVWHDVKATRPMPVFGVPGLVDHF